MVVSSLGFLFLFFSRSQTGYSSISGEVSSPEMPMGADNLKTKKEKAKNKKTPHNNFLLFVTKGPVYQDRKF